MKRLALVALVVSTLLLTRPDQALACSCDLLEPIDGLAEFDAAFVGTLIKRPGPTNVGAAAPYQFEVEQWVKGDLGSPLMVMSPFSGAACGFEMAVGERVGVLLTMQNGAPTGGLCTTVNPDLLLAGEDPLVLDGTGPPVFLIAGGSGRGRLLLLDAFGGLVAVAGEGESYQANVDLCPGSSHVVELVDDQLIVRTTVDLAEIRRVDLQGLPFQVAVHDVWCRDAEAETIWLSFSDSVQRFYLVDAETEEPIIDGPYGWLEVGTAYAVAGEGPSARSTWRVDLQTGDRTLLHEIPFEEGDSEPSATAWIDPSGTKALIDQFRYRDGVGGWSNLFLYDLGSGDLLWQSGDIPTSSISGWLDERRLIVFSYPGIDANEPDHLVVDVEAETIEEIDIPPGWRRHLILGDQIVGAGRGWLRALDLSSGEGTDIRLLPSDQHWLVAVLDPSAVISATTTSLQPTLEEAEDSEPTRQTPWLWIGAAAVVVLIASAATFSRRR